MATPGIKRECVFCDIVAGRAVATVVNNTWPDAICIVPLGPVVDGHVLVIPREHADDAKQWPAITAAAMKRAAEYAASISDDCNIIINVGKDAGQTVFHLHIHVVPRRAGDGLRMPWSKP